MPSRKVSKPHIVVPNGMSEEENSSESEDELENVQKKLKSPSMTDENSSSTEYSDSDESSEEEPPQRKKRKKCIGRRDHLYLHHQRSQGIRHLFRPVLKNRSIISIRCLAKTHSPYSKNNQISTLFKLIRIDPYRSRTEHRILSFIFPLV